jgi:hypothetical protein
MPEKDVILKLLEDPIPEGQLNMMSPTELQELNFGIERLVVLFHNEPTMVKDLRKLCTRVKQAENYSSFMGRLDEFLANRHIPTG